MQRALMIVLAGIFTLSLAALPDEAAAIPPFARKYRTSCNTCHVLFPKLNAFGEAFRLNAYEIPAPGGDEPFVKDEPVVLGAPAWKQLWPEAFWPGTIPGMPPVGLRIISDLQLTQDETKKFSSNFEFPHEVELLLGGTFGGGIGFFSQTEFKQSNQVSLMQAFLKVQDPLSKLGLPERALNLWVGKFDQNLLPAYRNFTRIGKNHPLWGNKRLSDLKLTNPSTGASRTFSSGFRNQDMQAGIEANGILVKRFGYSLGLAQGQKDEVFDQNNFKDVYYTLRYKLGGRALDGSLPGEETKVEAKATGGWVDNALHLEHFGYFGKFPVGGELDDVFNRFGGALRWTPGNLDLAVGVVWGHHNRPWATTSSEAADYRSAFVKAEYMIFPWLMGFLRWELLEVDRPSDVVNSGVTRGSLDRQRWLPGIAFSPRANMRVVFESE
ncbi:MAG: hypothetical protein HYY85_18490, partial [Deltaproteobacteria bacterium]|nr:hypothetical protein [Deltaproteobacteria bacterium]